MLDEIPTEVWKTREFDDIQLRHCHAIYNPNTIDRWTKRCIFPFSKILTIRRILEGVRAKNLEVLLYYLSTSPKPSTPYTAGRWSKYYSPTTYSKKPSQP